MAYWLFKSEPGVYSIDDLQRDRRTMWEGVRNYQARNLMREAHKGDGVLFYHSQTKEVAGLAEVVKEAYPDPTQFDKRSKYFDAKSDREEPRWSVVDVKFVRAFEEPIPLADLKRMPALEAMTLLKRGSRLSIQPVASGEWRAIVRRAR
ncbi:MAG: EVE domain-containing protein [Planctomycetota bacterium]|jgi:predicted RNA-binding protein with PUA-like domain